MSAAGEEALALAGAVVAGFALARLAWPGAAGAAARGLRGCFAAALALGLHGALGMAMLLGPGPQTRRWPWLLAGIALLSALALLVDRVLGSHTGRRERATPGLAAPIAITCEESVVSPATRGLRALCAAAALSFVVFSAEHAWRYPDGMWDAMAVWNLRPRALLRAGVDWRLAFQPADTLAHTDYPLLVPSLVLHGWRALGEERGVPIAVAAAFAGLLAGTLLCASVLLAGEAAGLLAASALLTTPCFVGLSTAQYADVPLALFALSAAVALVLARRGASRTSGARTTAEARDACPAGGARLLVLAGFFAGLGALCKNEGALHLLALAVALGAVALLDAPGLLSARALACGRELGWFLLGAAAPLALLWAFKRAVPRNDLLAMTGLLDLPRRMLELNRLAVLGEQIALHLIRVKDWGLFLSGLLLIWVLLWTRRRALPPEARMPALASGFALLGFLITLWLTPHDVLWHTRTAIDRLILQCWPTALLATALAFAPARSLSDSSLPQEPLRELKSEESG